MLAALPLEGSILTFGHAAEHSSRIIEAGLVLDKEVLVNVPVAEPEGKTMY